MSESEEDIQLLNMVSTLQTENSNSEQKPEEMPSPKFVTNESTPNVKPYQRATSLNDAYHRNGHRNYESFSSLPPIFSSTNIATVPEEAGVQELPLRGRNSWLISKQGATLVWRDVCVYATTTSSKATSKNLRRIINNSTGAIQPGTLMAVMGSRFVFRK